MGLADFNPALGKYLDVENGALLPIKKERWSQESLIRIVEFLGKANIKDHSAPENAQGAFNLLLEVRKLPLESSKRVANLLTLIWLKKQNFINFISRLPSPIVDKIFTLQKPLQHLLVPLLEQFDLKIQIEIIELFDQNTSFRSAELLCLNLINLSNFFTCEQAVDQISKTLTCLKSKNEKEKILLYVSLERPAQEVVIESSPSYFEDVDALLIKFNNSYLKLIIEYLSQYIPDENIIITLNYFTSQPGLLYFNTLSASLKIEDPDFIKILLFRLFIIHIDFSQDLRVWSQKPETIHEVHKSIQLRLDSIRTIEELNPLLAIIVKYRELLGLKEQDILYQRLFYLQNLLDPSIRFEPNHPFELENAIESYLIEQEILIQHQDKFLTILNRRPLFVSLNRIRTLNALPVKETTLIQQIIKISVQRQNQKVLSNQKLLQQVMNQDEIESRPLITQYLTFRLHSIIGSEAQPFSHHNCFILPKSLVEMSTIEIFSAFIKHYQADDLSAAFCDAFNQIIFMLEYKDLLKQYVNTLREKFTEVHFYHPNQTLTIEGADTILFDQGLFMHAL